MSLPSWTRHRPWALDTAGVPGTKMKYGNGVGLAEPRRTGSKQGATSEKRVWNKDHLDKAKNPTGAGQAYSAGSGPMCSFPSPASMPFLAPEGLAGDVPQWRAGILTLDLCAE